MIHYLYDTPNFFQASHFKLKNFMTRLFFLWNPDTGSGPRGPRGPSVRVVLLKGPRGPRGPGRGSREKEKKLSGPRGPRYICRIRGRAPGALGAPAGALSTKKKSRGFYTKNLKIHVPALILKFLTTTPNLTSNFETWHQILKPIRILVKTLIIYIGSCIHYLCTVRV